jgi:hypothetical protein
MLIKAIYWSPSPPNGNGVYGRPKLSAMVILEESEGCSEYNRMIPSETPVTGDFMRVYQY